MMVANSGDMTAETMARHFQMAGSTGQMMADSMAGSIDLEQKTVCM